MHLIIRLIMNSVVLSATGLLRDSPRNQLANNSQDNIRTLLHFLNMNFDQLYTKVMSTRYDYITSLAPGLTQLSRISNRSITVKRLVWESTMALTTALRTSSPNVKKT